MAYDFNEHAILPTSPLDRRAKVLQLQQLYQQQQLGQQQQQANQQNQVLRQQQITENDQQAQSRDRDTQEQQVLMEAYGQAQGDLERLRPLIAGKVSAKTMLGIEQAIMQQRQQRSAASSEALKNNQATLEIMRNASQSILSVPPEQRPQAYAQVRAGLTPELQQQAPEQYPGDQWLQLHAYSFEHELKKNAEEIKRRELQQQTAHQQAQEILQRRGQDITVRGQNMTDARQRDQNQIAREAKVDAKRNADQTQLASFESNVDRLSAAANELLNHEGLGGITGVSGAFPNMPGGKAAGAQAKLQTLKSQVAFGTLQEMRNASKTGGALGSVSEKELGLLESNLAALDKAQSLEEFKDSLKKIVKYGEEAKERARGAFNRNYGASGNPPSAGVSVKDPTGKVHTFPNQATADAFKKAAGIR